jgi:hypothetical protein
MIAAVQGVAIFLVAVAGAVPLGHPVVTAVFRRVSRPGTAVPGAAAPDPEAARAPQLAEAAHALPGGRWIGYLERASIVSALVAGWPEGIALVIAIKGLGRYQELRSATPGTAERFIIGTFTSVLWACGWGLLARWGIHRLHPNG